MGARKNARERRHARGEGVPSPLARLPRARPFFLAPIYFLAPATQASASISLPACQPGLGKSFLTGKLEIFFRIAQRPVTVRYSQRFPRPS